MVVAIGCFHVCMSVMLCCVQVHLPDTDSGTEPTTGGPSTVAVSLFAHEGKTPLHDSWIPIRWLFSLVCSGAKRRIYWKPLIWSTWHKKPETHTKTPNQGNQHTTTTTTTASRSSPVRYITHTNDESHKCQRGDTRHHLELWIREQWSQARRPIAPPPSPSQFHHRGVQRTDHQCQRRLVQGDFTECKGRFVLFVCFKQMAELSTVVSRVFQCSSCTMITHPWFMVMMNDDVVVCIVSFRKRARTMKSTWWTSRWTRRIEPSTCSSVAPVSKSSVSWNSCRAYFGGATKNQLLQFSNI